MRISDWSSYVCSSDLGERATDRRKAGRLVSPACESLELSDKSAYLSIYLGLESQYHGAEAATVLAGKFRRFGGGFARPAAGTCRDDPVRPPPRPVPLRNAARPVHAGLGRPAPDRALFGAVRRGAPQFQFHAKSEEHT